MGKCFRADDPFDFVSLHAAFTPNIDTVTVPVWVSPVGLSFEATLTSCLSSRPSLIAIDTLVGVFERHASQESVVRLLSGAVDKCALSVSLFLYRWLLFGPVVAPSALSLFSALRDRLREFSSECAAILKPVSSERKTASVAELTPLIRERQSAEKSPIWELMHSHALAAQLTAIEEQHLDGLTLSDIAHGRILTECGQQFAHWLVRCPVWVATEIVNSDDKARAIVYFLKVVVQLLDIRNTCSFALVMEGLLHESVQRLTVAWDSVLAVHGDSWAWLVQSATPASLKKPRRAPVIAHVQLIQLEVWQILFDAQSDLNTQKRCIGDAVLNWEVETRIHLAIKPWLELQKSGSYKYGFVRHNWTINYLLKDARVMTAAELGVTSRLLQPENQTLSDAVKSAGGLVSGFSSWLKSSPATVAEEAKRSLRDAVFLPGSDWSELFSRGETVKFAQKAVLLEAGALNTSIWRVKKGAVSVLSDQGFIIATLGEGQVFGELAMVYAMGIVVPASIISVSPVCEVQKVPFTVMASALRVKNSKKKDFFFF
jgi:hypothetical protein